MPTYDYFCKKCKVIYEIEKSMKDAKRKKCPKGHIMRKLVHGPVIIFTGTGFTRKIVNK